MDLKEKMHATTILCVRDKKEVVLIGDGQVSLGNTVMKSTARKLRRISSDNIIAGFAGSTADAFTLFERLEEKIDRHAKNLMRAAIELAKDWRMEKYLRRLEAMLIVADKNSTLVLSGNGDVLEPEHDAIAIGSGGQYATAAARALLRVGGLSAYDIAIKSMEVAAEICVYTNNNFSIERIVIEEIEQESSKDNKGDKKSKKLPSGKKSK